MPSKNENPTTPLPRFDTSRVVFLGSPSFAVASLESLLASGREISLVVTQPDRRAGRGRNLKPPEVKSFALAHRIPVIQPTKMKDPEFLSTLREANTNLFVVAAYGRLLPEALLSIPKLSLNVHASLLPRWRGASPIQRAVAAGDEWTGVSIMKVVQELDAGDVCHTVKTRIDPQETAGELEARLASMGGQALVEALDRLEQGQARFEPQDPSLVTLAPLLTKEEGKVDWNRPAQMIHNQIRGLHPWPGAYAEFQGKRVKFHRSSLTSQLTEALPGTVEVQTDFLCVACQDEWLNILTLQLEGKAVQTSAEFLRGHRITSFE